MVSNRTFESINSVFVVSQYSVLFIVFRLHLSNLGILNLVYSIVQSYFIFNCCKFISYLVLCCRKFIFKVLVYLISIRIDFIFSVQIVSSQIAVYFNIAVQSSFSNFETTFTVSFIFNVAFNIAIGSVHFVNNTRTIGLNCIAKTSNLFIAQSTTSRYRNMNVINNAVIIAIAKLTNIDITTIGASSSEGI